MPAARRQATALHQAMGANGKEHQPAMDSLNEKTQEYGLKGSFLPSSFPCSRGNRSEEDPDDGPNLESRAESPPLSEVSVGEPGKEGEPEPGIGEDVSCTCAEGLAEAGALTSDPAAGGAATY